MGLLLVSFCCCDCCCVAGSQIGDKAAIEELNRHGAIYHHIVLDVDPVPDLRQSKGKGYMERDWEHTVVVRLALSPYIQTVAVLYCVGVCQCVWRCMRICIRMDG